MIASYLYSTLEKGKNVPSPCISVCQIDSASNFCGGCLRTLDEISAWASLDDAAKLIVWERLAQRATDALTRTDADADADAALQLVRIAGIAPVLDPSRDSIR